MVPHDRDEEADVHERRGVPVPGYCLRSGTQHEAEVEDFLSKLALLKLREEARQTLQAMPHVVGRHPPFFSQLTKGELRPEAAGPPAWDIPSGVHSTLTIS
jgi:hypothetical protein